MINYTKALLQYFAICIFISLLLLPSSAQSQGSLVVNPKRVVLTATQRNGVLSVFNTGDDTASYAISFKHFEMKQNGDLTDLDTLKDDGSYADTLVRFFPREVTLAPHSSQIVRVQYLKPPDLPIREYRSHLYFRTIDRSKALTAPPADTQNSVSIRLKVIYGIAIPIIVRNKTTAATVTVDNVTFAPSDSEMTTVSASINRKGNESVYGTLLLTHRDAKGTVTPLSMLKGIAVYVPLASRTCQFRFKTPTDIDIHHGSLKVEYQSLTNEAKEVTMASSELQVDKH
jgi:P pilus assembly chaperone PapD